MSVLRLSLRLQANERAPGAARHALDGLELYVGEDLCRTTKLLISELVTNSIRHAGLGTEDLVEVTVTATDGSVRVEVEDPGRGFESDGIPTRPPAEDSGWGFVLTDGMSERWGAIGLDGARVWFEVTSSGSPHELPDDLRRRDPERRGNTEGRVGRRRT